MNDYFALLDEAHRPWLDPDSLKSKFLALSSKVHPDLVHQAGVEERRLAEQRYADINQAYQHLRRPKERLQHLLELETGQKPAQVQQIPADLTQFFIEVGQLFKQIDAFLDQKARASSPLLQVRLFEESHEWTEKLNLLQRKLNERQQELLNELQAIDVRWMERARAEAVERATMLRRLEQLYRLFSYYGRWETQVQEKIVQLAT
jgi:DnaJ-domain-containing protein 1